MANLKTSEKKSKAQSMGMHTEVLTGRTQQKFFNPDEAENFYYFGTYDVDFNKRTDLDVKEMSAPEANKEIDNLMSQGYGTIVIKNPQGKHSLGVGILNKLNLIFEGSLGYFGMGSCDGPTVRINGRVGWSCAENMMSGKVVVENNAGSCFGAALRGGDLIVKGDAGGGVAAAAAQPAEEARGGERDVARPVVAAGAFGERRELEGMAEAVEVRRRLRPSRRRRRPLPRRRPLHRLRRRLHRGRWRYIVAFPGPCRDLRLLLRLVRGAVGFLLLGHLSALALGAILPMAHFGRCVVV